MLSALLLLVGFAAGMWYQGFRLRTEESSERIALNGAAASAGASQGETEVTTEPEAQDIEVYVTGAVAYPRVYKVPSGTRVYEAVELAAPLAEAETMGLDMARLLEDEETVIVPYRADADDQAAAQAAEAVIAASGSTGGKVNINTASVAELDTLPGIGPVLAQRIVDYREQNGKFKDVSELLNVSGIGDQRLADITPHITLR
ncbi:MAG: helix-hairpin-helix domain-containing protein [Syntrophomonadaceae bacterium]|nr:helix-hairpin-helix domain-containing protein [Syntrophomonadaceae bacterium]